jgi:DNA-binding transcriptional MerR regulator
MSKSAEAFRTISEVADWLEVQTHVLRFWESKFSQIKPVKRAGGRRYYRPQDMLLLGGIKHLLHEDGMTIKGVQKILKEKGATAVSDHSRPLIDDALDEPTVQAPSEPVLEPVFEPSLPDTDLSADAPTLQDTLPCAPVLTPSATPQPEDADNPEPPFSLPGPRIDESSPSQSSPLDVDAAEPAEVALPPFSRGRAGDGQTAPQPPETPAGTNAPVASALDVPMPEPATTPTPAPPPNNATAKVTEDVSGEDQAEDDALADTASPQIFSDPVISHPPQLPTIETPLLEALFALQPGQVATKELRGIYDRMRSLRERIGPHV